MHYEKSYTSVHDHVWRGLTGSWDWSANGTGVTFRWLVDKGLNSAVFPYETVLIGDFDWSLLKHHLTDYLLSVRAKKKRHITNISMSPADCHTHAGPHADTAAHSGSAQQRLCAMIWDSSVVNSRYREEQHILFPGDAAGLLPVLFIVSEIMPANEELGGSG